MHARRWKLSAAQRAEMWNRWKAGQSGRAQYRANEADRQAWESDPRPKPCLLATHSKLQQIVASKLMQDWSPQRCAVHRIACNAFVRSIPHILGVGRESVRLARTRRAAPPSGDGIRMSGPS
jgi:hypothetical protein